MRRRILLKLLNYSKITLAAIEFSLVAVDFRIPNVKEKAPATFSSDGD